MPQKVFNTILEEYRADILPIIVENWSELTDIEQDQLTRMNNFFCSLRFLVGLANSAENALKLWEANMTGETTLPSSSGTQRLVRTACKAFHHRGSQQAIYFVHS